MGDSGATRGGQIPRRGGGGPWPVLGSLALNIFLAAGLLRPARSLTAARPRIEVPIPATVRPATNLPSASDVNAPAAIDSPKAPFRWAEIESADYRQYVANLRTVGCPEPVIRHIVIADLNQLHASRMQAVWQARRWAYWQKPEHDNPGPDQIRQLKALDEEKARLAQDLLGVKPHSQDLIDAVFLQLHGSEHQLMFLPEDRRDAAPRRSKTRASCSGKTVLASSSG